MDNFFVTTFNNCPCCYILYIVLQPNRNYVWESFGQDFSWSLILAVTPALKFWVWIVFTIFWFVFFHVDDFLCLHNVARPCHILGPYGNTLWVKSVWTDVFSALQALSKNKNFKRNTGDISESHDHSSDSFSNHILHFRDFHCETISRIIDPFQKNILFDGDKNFFIWHCIKSHFFDNLFNLIFHHRLFQHLRDISTRPVIGVTCPANNRAVVGALPSVEYVLSSIKWVPPEEPVSPHVAIASLHDCSEVEAWHHADLEDQGELNILKPLLFHHSAGDVDKNKEMRKHKIQ